MRRGVAVTLAALMVVFGALPGLAADRPTEDRASVESVDRPAERPTQQTDAAAVVRDREVDPHRCVDVVTDRRCLDDRHPHVNVRHLIQRLINAGEWEKLFRLLHRLGII